MTLYKMNSLMDYRKLNLQTVKDAYALPNLEETFSVLSGSQWFSVLDLKSGYYQIELAEEDKHKTAFVCPLGFWEFNRLPQGITNAPSTFQRLMERCVSDLNLKEVIVFLDDLIVFSATLEEHEQRLLRVLQRLKEYGLKLSPEKCKFFQTSVKYLGHVVSRNGVETDPEKIKTLRDWPSPRHLKELQSFLGFAGYYRRFIQDYSKIVKPLNSLTIGYGPAKRSKVNSGKSPLFKPKEPFGCRWTEECQSAFTTIIDKLTSAPVLAYANSKLPYVLHTDASTTGLGAALYQEQDGQLRAIAFASRGLSHSESRYPAHKLEFLALKWAVTEKFSDYLYGNTFTVITDSNPLTYILTSAKLDATSYRWLSALSTFSFTLRYRPGKQNLDADALSRRPHDHTIDDPISQKEEDRIRQFTLKHLPELADNTKLDTEVVHAICEARLVRQSSNKSSEGSRIPFVESLASNPDCLPDDFVQDEFLDGFPLNSRVPAAEVRDKQNSDVAIREIISSLKGGGVPSPSVKKEIPQLSLLCREWNKLFLKDGILYRRRQGEQEMQYQLVLPEQWRDMVMTSLHDNMGHLGVERTLDLVRSRFYWPGMAHDISHKIRTCRRCILRKAPLERAAPLVNIRATRPLELVCMDFLSIEPDRSNTKDVLVITDFFTKYAVAVPTPNQKAKTVAKCLWEHFIVHYGIPERLHSDQGPDFESKTIKELCEVIGTHKIRTTPYHPRGNPVERFNRTLLSMIGTLREEQKAHWHDFVQDEFLDGFPLNSRVPAAEVRDKQNSDVAIREIISSLKGGGVPSPSVKKEIPQLSLLCREWNKLFLKDGILYRRRQGEQEMQYQLVLPEQWRDMVMTSLHDNMGHLGVERTLDLVRSRFYWPGMAHDISHKIRTCRRCILRKAPLERAAPLVNIRATRPLELVCMDFLSIEPDRSNTKDVLVITDFFTKYAVAVPTPNQKAKTVAKCLWEHFIVHYGIPERLHSDQGPDFESKTIKELCEVIGTHKIRTTPYHPRGNPVERFNRTLLSMIGTLREEQKAHWHDFVKPLVHAYNCTKHESTGFTPYELMFGRRPRLPIDLIFDIFPGQPEGKSHSQYVKHLKMRLEESYKLAMGNTTKMAEKNKTRFDKRVVESTLEEGDRVLVRNVKLRGKHKLADRWEPTVHVIVKRAGELPVYTVRPENQKGQLRTLHRDLLRPCNFLSTEDVTPKIKVTKPRTRAASHINDPEESEVDSDFDESPIHYYTYPLRFNPIEATCSIENPPKTTSENIPEVISENLPENLPEMIPENLPEMIPENPPEDRDVFPELPGETSHITLVATDPTVHQTDSKDTPEQVEPESKMEEETEIHQQSCIAEEDEMENPVRHSTRSRTRAKRLTYPELGNPLISVVQSLFQGLSTAFTQSLLETPYGNPDSPDYHALRMHRDVHTV
uniref:Gypsy retrotransposon integrase-like protein 1 n=1 Tax=Astyanax mexicanus TaxID=7994 RepID=A0A3B1IZP3_ASTMX